MTEPSATEEKTGRYTLRYKSCEQCQQSKRLSTFGHRRDICIQCLRYLNDPNRQFPDLNHKLFDSNLPQIIEGIQKSVEESQISHHQLLQHITQLTTRISNLESRNLEPQVTERPMESKDSEIQNIRQLLADTAAENEIWKSRAITLEAQLNPTQERIKILEAQAVEQQQILDQKTLELEKLILERDNLQDRCQKEEVEARSQREQYITEIQRLKEELKDQEQKYIEEIRHLEEQSREPQVRMTPSTVAASSSSVKEESSPLPNRYIMTPSVGYGPFVAERRLVYEPATPSSPIQALAAWMPAVDQTARPVQVKGSHPAEQGPGDSAESRSTPKKPPSIKFRSPAPTKA